MHSTYKIPKKSRIRSFVSFWKSFCVFLIQQQQQNTEIPTGKNGEAKKSECEKLHIYIFDERTR